MSTQLVKKCADNVFPIGEGNPGRSSGVLIRTRPTIAPVLWVNDDGKTSTGDHARVYIDLVVHTFISYH